MKIAIVGTGAMGCVYAALFAEAGHEVWAVDIWKDHVDAINQKGLTLEGASGDRVVSGIRATTDIADVGQCDLYVLATKASGVGPAAKNISEVMGSEGLVLTIQNGLGAADRIAQHMDTSNVLLGVAEGFGASLKGPGHAHHNAMRQIRIGEITSGMTPRLQALEKAWASAGFKAKAFDDIEQLIWEKFLCNCTLSAPCTVFECNTGELRNNEERWNVAVGGMLEGFAIGKKLGVNFSFDDAVAYVTAFAETMPNANPSMRLDHLARRPSEIDAINGMIPYLGRQHGIPTPYSDALCAVVRAREAQF
ncbi:MAG: 2-dehydropantoate 2-reductase [Alphaproteobacteria bacterium]|nr:2-dehydropantoate 2-reductase [Alphaproteobacteria bacterium]